MNEQATLKVGDTVLWSGAFGMDAPRRATVLGIEQTEHPREKYGWGVDEIDWQAVRENRAVVTVQGENATHENWAYGEQIKPCNA